MPTIEERAKRCAHIILGTACSCYAEAWPQQSCENVKTEVGRVIADFARLYAADMVRKSAGKAEASRTIINPAEDQEDQDMAEARNTRSNRIARDIRAFADRIEKGEEP